MNTAGLCHCPPGMRKRGLTGVEVFAQGHKSLHISQVSATVKLCNKESSEPVTDSDTPSWCSASWCCPHWAGLPFSIGLTPYLVPQLLGDRQKGLLPKSIDGGFLLHKCPAKT